MAKRAWLIGRSTDPVIGARAFAAVGALTAAHWKPSDCNYDDALASIVKAGSGLIPWQHPSSSEVIAGTYFDEAALAKAWDQAFPGGSSADSPIARLTVDTLSFTNVGATLQDGLAAAYRKLLDPWMGRLDDGKPGQIAALSFATFDHAGRHDWHWPIRIGLPHPDQALTEKLGAARGVRREFMEIVSPGLANTDIVLLSEPELKALPTSTELPGLAIVYRSPGEAASGQFAEISGMVTAPTALIEASQTSIPRFLNEFSDEIAHNKPLDVAIFDAYRTIFDPKGALGGSLAPLILLAPTTNQETTFGGIRLENRVKELSDRLGRLPGHVIVGGSPGGAKHLGITKSARTVQDYRSAMSKAIEHGNLNLKKKSSAARA
jgi:hypothetical protein